MVLMIIAMVRSVRSKCGCARLQGGHFAEEMILMMAMAMAMGDKKITWMCIASIHIVDSSGQ